jgi:hypothetical protein
MAIQLLLDMAVIPMQVNFTTASIPLPQDRHDKRADYRYSTGESPAEVSIPGTNVSFNGLVMDVSKSGMRIRAENQVEVDTTVRVKMATLLVDAEVRYCKPNDAGSQDFGVMVLRTCSNHSNT